MKKIYLLLFVKIVESLKVISINTIQSTFFLIWLMTSILYYKKNLIYTYMYNKECMCNKEYVYACHSYTVLIICTFYFFRFVYLLKCILIPTQHSQYFYVLSFTDVPDMFPVEVKVIVSFFYSTLVL